MVVFITARLAAVDTAGRFELATLVEESAESRNGETIRRITFTPATLEAHMSLTFELTFE